MKPLALVLFAVLVLSFVPYVAIQQASALSAITFTNETTVTSYNEQWQQVYENGTSSTVYLDAAVNGTYKKSAWDGSTLDTDTASLSGSGNTVDSHAYISPVDLSRYSLDFNGVDQYVIVPDSPSLGGMSELTIVCRGNYDTFVIGDAYPCIGKTQYGGSFELVVHGNKAVELCIQNDVGTWGCISAFSSFWTPNTWYFVTGTYDGDTGQGTIKVIDENGDVLLDYSQAFPFTGSVSDNGVNVQIGKGGDPNRIMKGKLDDIALYDEVKTLPQLQNIAVGQYDTNDLISWWDFNDGVGSTLNDIFGSNDGTLQNSPVWSSDVTANSVSRPTIYVTGRDSGSSTNGYGKWNLADLSEVDDEYFSSDLAPLGIAQSTSNLYSTAIGSSNYGTLYDVSVTRAFGSYTETSIHTGDSTTPAMAIHMDVPGGTNSIRMYAAAEGPIAAEAALTNSVLIGDSFNRITLSLAKVGAPVGNAVVGVFDSSGNTVFTCTTFAANTLLTTSQTDYTFICGSTHTIALNERIGIRHTGDSTNHILAYYNSAGNFDGTASQTQYYDAGWSTTGISGGTAADMRMKIGLAQGKTVVYDGSPDTRYHFFISGTDGDIRVVKRTGSTSLLATAMDHTIGQPFSVIQLTDRIIIQTATDTYQLLTSNDSISLLHPNAFNTRYSQTYEISPAARTFNSNAAYIANSTYAINYTPNTGANARTGVFIDSVTTGGDGMIDPYDPNRYYYLSKNDLTVEASAGSNTWTIKDVGNRQQIQITAYSEDVGIDLVENTKAILDLDVIKLSCDNGNYLIEIQNFAIGDDDDCNLWRILDTAGEIIGRTLPYTTSPSLVHNSDYTNYNIHVTVTSGNATTYAVQIVYRTTNVDRSFFDAGSNAQLRMLYGQCYDLQFIEILSGDIVQSQTVCADDVTFKEALLSTDLGLPFWSAPWGVASTYNVDTAILTVIVQHTPTPYSYDVRIENGTGTTIISQHYANVTNDVDTTVYNLTSYLGEEPFRIKVYRNDTGYQIYSKYFGEYGSYLDGLRAQIDDAFGTFEGWSILMFLPLIFAAMFTRNTAGIGGGMIVAFIGVLVFMGVLQLPEGVIWLITFIALVGLLAYRIFF